MKRIFSVMVAMALCVYGMYAQNLSENVEEIANATDTSAISTDNGVVLNEETMAELFRLFNSAAGSQNVKTTDDYKGVYYPVESQKKFWRSHHVDQRMEISVLGGKDKNHDHTGDYVESATENPFTGDGGMNSGFNAGYSLIFIPGKVEGDKLHINKFGFGYSIGFIAAFDSQKNHGVTCDFMGKIGVETGNGHDIGLGIDFLIGTGKSAGDYTIFATDEQGNVLYEDDDNTLVINTTEWCFKYGAQLWVRSNLLRTGIGNTDVRLFARYVYSKDPMGQETFKNSPIFWDWVEESWQFGVTFCYTF